MDVRIACHMLFAWLFLCVFPSRADSDDVVKEQLYPDQEGSEASSTAQLLSPSPAFIFSAEASTQQPRQTSVTPPPSTNTLNFNAVLSSNPIMRGFAMFDHDVNLNQISEDVGSTVSTSPNYSAASDRRRSDATYVPVLVTDVSRVDSDQHTVQQMESAQPRTVEGGTWAVFARTAFTTSSPIDDTGKDNFGEHYRFVNSTYFTQGVATSESEVEHELLSLRTGKMPAKRNGTAVESDLRGSFPIYTLNETALVETIPPQIEGATASTMMAKIYEDGSEETTETPFNVVDSIFITSFTPSYSSSILLSNGTDDSMTSTVEDHGAEQIVSDINEATEVDQNANIDETPFFAVADTFDSASQIWKSHSALNDSAKSSVIAEQHAFPDSSFWSDSVRTTQPSSSVLLSHTGAIDHRSSTESTEAASMLLLGMRTPNPWEMQRSHPTSIAVETDVSAEPRLDELSSHHFDRIDPAERNADGIAKFFGWDTSTTPSTYEEIESHVFASTTLSPEPYNSIRGWATWMETSTVVPFSIISSHRNSLLKTAHPANFYPHNNAITHREGLLNEDYSRISHTASLLPHLQDEFVSSISDESLGSLNELSLAAGADTSAAFNMELGGSQLTTADLSHQYEDSNQMDGWTNGDQITSNIHLVHSSIAGSAHTSRNDEQIPSRNGYGRVTSKLAVFNPNINGNQVNGREQNVELSDGYDNFHAHNPNVEERASHMKTAAHPNDLALGISLPKYSVFPYYPPKQRGVSIAQSGRSRTSFEHMMLNGKLVEKQKYLDGGRLVTVELWNRALHGHDLMARPGSIVGGSLRPLQKDVINIGVGRNNIERERLKALMDKTSGRTHAAGVRNQVASVSQRNAEHGVRDKNGVDDYDSHYLEDVDRERYPSSDKSLVNFMRDFNTENDDSLQPSKCLNADECEQKRVHNLDECLVVSDGFVLMGASPFERRTTLTQARCAQFCLSLEYCVSALYSSSMFTCDAFNTKNGSGSARLLRLNGYSYLEPKPSDSAACLSEASRALPTLSGISFAYNRDHAASSTLPYEELVYTSFAVNRNDDILPAYPSNTHFKGGCQSGETVVFQKSVGWRLTRKTGSEMEFVSLEEDCIFACSVNLAEDSAPFECSSAVYDSTSGMCTLSMLSAGQDRNDDLSSDPHTIYFEKTCLNDSLAALCRRKRIERQPQHVLLEHASTTTTVSSLGACIQRCFTSLFDGDTFQCRSAFYFHEKGVENCVLNRSTRIERPDDFAEEIASPVDYIGLDECLPTRSTRQFSERV